MATLTTSWQNVGYYRWQYSSQFIVDFYLDAKYSSQSIASNYSSVQTRLRSVLVTGYGSGTGYSFSCTYATPISGSEIWYFGTEEILSGSSDVYHESDGTKTISFSAYVYNGYLGLNYTFYGSASLPTIPRTSDLSNVSLTVANNGSSVTGTPTINKKSSSFYDVLYIMNGSTTIASISGVTSGTSFSLNSSQISSLYSAIGTDTSKALSCYLKTYTSNGGSLIGQSSTIWTTVTLPDYSITANISTYTDSGSYTTYYDSTNQIVDYLSSPNVTFTYSSSTGSYYGRSASHYIKYYNTSGTETTKTSASPISITDYGRPYDTTGLLTLVVSDGRKTASKTLASKSYTRVSYQLPKITSAEVLRTSSTASTATVTITGTYYDGTSLINTLTRALSLSYTETGGTAHTLSTFTYTETTDSTTHITTFTATGNLTGLDYKKAITYTATLTDKVGKTISSNGSIPQGLPVWNAYTTSSNENRFNINGGLMVGGTLVLYDDGN